VSTHLFVDESQRRPYLLVAGVVTVVELAASRSVLRALCAPGDRRLHFQSERDSRRRELLSHLIRAEFRTWVYAGHGRPEEVRRACLRQLVADAVKSGATRLVMESRGDVLDRSDRQVVARAVDDVAAAGLAYTHLRPHEEPLLWLPDAVAWSYGAGGDWRRRVAPLVETVVEFGDVGH
jgi:hypothetical protein